METRAHYVVVGAFVVVILIGAFISGLWLTSAQFEREGAIYDSYFRGSVSGLTESAPVRYKGVLIGRVISIRLDPENVERIRVRIEVDAATPIKEDAVAELEAQGITGLAFVQITGGSNASQVLEKREDKRYPIIASRQSGLEEVVTSAPELFKRATLVADRIALVLSDANVAAITQTLDHISIVTGTIADSRSQIDKVMIDASSTMSEVRGAANEAMSLWSDSRATLKGRDGTARRPAHPLRELNLRARK